MKPFDLTQAGDRWLLASSVGFWWTMRVPGGLLHLQKQSPPGVGLLYRRFEITKQHPEGAYMERAKLIGWKQASCAMHAKARFVELFDPDPYVLLERFEAELPRPEIDWPLEQLPMRWTSRWSSGWRCLKEGLLLNMWMSSSGSRARVWVSTTGSGGGYQPGLIDVDERGCLEFASVKDAQAFLHLLSVGRCEEAYMQEAL